MDDKTGSDDIKIAFENVHICITCDHLRRIGEHYVCGEGNDIQDFTSVCERWQPFREIAS